MQNGMPMMTTTWKSKPEVEFQRDGRLSAIVKKSIWRHKFDGSQFTNDGITSQHSDMLAMAECWKTKQTSGVEYGEMRHDGMNVLAVWGSASPSP